MPEDKDLRRTRDRFSGSIKIHTAIREAVLDNPDVTEFDLERITSQLVDNGAEFKHIEDFGAFRDAVVAWAGRQAELIAQLRAILQGIQFDSHVVRMLFLRLPEFAGTDAEFPPWVLLTAERDRVALDTLATWIMAYRVTVFCGIRKGLRGVHKLDSYPQDIIDCLSSELWQFVASNIHDFSGDSPSQLRKHLQGKAKWMARAWAKKRREDIASGAFVLPDYRYTIGVHGLERTAINNGEQYKSEVSEIDVMDPRADHNLHVIRELPWTNADLEREFRRAGPFKTSDSEMMELLCMATAA